MGQIPDPPSEVSRLEDLWGGEFGDAYVERNRNAGDMRGPFWASLLARFPVQRALEVGCNTGANLRWLAGAVPEISWDRRQSSSIERRPTHHAHCERRARCRTRHPFPRPLVRFRLHDGSAYPSAARSHCRW